jgi:hypothetical protein
MPDDASPALGPPGPAVQQVNLTLFYDDVRAVWSVVITSTVSNGQSIPTGVVENMSLRGLPAERAETIQQEIDEARGVDVDRDRRVRCGGD